MSTWTVELPWSGPLLRDNDRPHWAQKARLTRTLRDAALLLARQAQLPIGLDRVRIELHWQPPMGRRRDQLSISPTLKPLVDGLVDYGLVADDDTEHVRLECVIEPVAKPARLWLEITDLTSAENIPANIPGVDHG